MEETTRLYEINSDESMICKQCKTERMILNKEQICIFCSHPRVKGTEAKHIAVGKKGGSIVEVKQPKFIKEYR